MATVRQIIADLVAKFEPAIQEAFLQGVDEIRNAITLRVIVERLERGDIEGAIEAMQIDAEAFARLELTFREAYNAGGAATVANLPKVTDPAGNRVVFRFGVRNMPAERWLEQHAAQLVTRTTEDMKQAVRVALTEGLTQGQNPRRTAVSVVGKTSRATNRREGGILGLTSPQERYVAAARAELLSGDPAQMQNYLERGRRDKRFDRTVAKAMREGKPLTAADVDKITGRYSDKLLQLRGEMIAQNETMTALAKAREDAIEQQVAAGKLDRQDIEEVWQHTPQERPRLHHKAMHGQAVAYGQKFTLPNGVTCSGPHADDMPASERMFCKCFKTFRINYTAAGVRRYRQRTGEAA